METFPRVCLHQDLENDLANIRKASAFIPSVRSKLESLPFRADAGGAPPPSSWRGGAVHYGDETGASTEHDGLCRPQATGVSEGAGEGEGRHRDMTDREVEAPGSACPSSLQEQSDSIVQFETFYVSNVIKKFRLARIRNAHVALQMPFCPTGWCRLQFGRNPFSYKGNQE